MEESGKVSSSSDDESSSIHVYYEQGQPRAECESSSDDSSSDSDGNGPDVTIRPATKPARQCESSSEDSSSEESDGVAIRSAKQCESSSEDSSSDEDGGASIRPAATVPAWQSGNLLPPWWPISSVETEAGKKFWQTPELVDKLLLMLDVQSMLSLAEVQPLAVRILQAGSQPWNKLITEALDNPFIPYVHGYQTFERQETLVKRTASTILAKMEDPRPLLMELLDLICVKYNTEERPLGRPMFSTREPLRVQVTCPLHVSHTVSGYGFILLEACEGTLGSAEQHLETILESDCSSYLSDFELPSVSSRLSRQPRTMERIQFSELRLKSKDVIDTWLHVLQNCDQAHGLRYVLVYDDIGTGGWQALAKALRLHQPYMLRFQSYL